MQDAGDRNQVPREPDFRYEAPNGKKSFERIEIAGKYSNKNWSRTFIDRRKSNCKASENSLLKMSVFSDVLHITKSL